MKFFTRTASVIFGIAALVHLYRLLSGFDIAVGETEIPHWVSVPLFIFALVMCAGLWRESKK